MIESALLISLMLKLDINKLNIDQIFPNKRYQEESVSATSTSVFSEDFPNFLAQDIPVVEEKGFTFQLEECVVTSGASSPLTCELLIQSNHNSERKLAIYAYASRRSFSRVVDVRGNEILASSAQLGSSSSDRAAEAYLSKGIPIRASVSFEAAPDGGIRIVDLGCYLYGNGGGSFDVEFRLSSLD